MSDDQEEAPKCRECGGELRIAWIVPPIGNWLPEIRTFRCMGCKALFSDEGNPSQPMTKLD
jgi:hypothetical protein